LNEIVNFSYSICTKKSTFFVISADFFKNPLYNKKKVFFMYKRLVELRKEKRLSQTQLSSILNMSQTGYSKYETGENDIPTSILIRLSDIFDASIDYILGISDVRTKQ